MIKEVAYDIIAEIVDNVFEYCDRDDTMDNMRLVTLGEIQGVIKLVEVLKSRSEECKARMENDA